MVGPVILKYIRILQIQDILIERQRVSDRQLIRATVCLNEAINPLNSPIQDVGINPTQFIIIFFIVIVIPNMRIPLVISPNRMEQVIQIILIVRRPPPR